MQAADGHSTRCVQEATSGIAATLRAELMGGADARRGGLTPAPDDLVEHTAVLLLAVAAWMTGVPWLTAVQHAHDDARGARRRQTVDEHSRGCLDAVCAGLVAALQQSHKPGTSVPWGRLPPSSNTEGAHDDDEEEPAQGQDAGRHYPTAVRRRPEEVAGSVGWRAWLLDEGRLLPPYASLGPHADRRPWRPGVNVARCYKRHPAPSPGCECGFRAMNDLEGLRRSLDVRDLKRHPMGSEWFAGPLDGRRSRRRR